MILCGCGFLSGFLNAERNLPNLSSPSARMRRSRLSPDKGGHAFQASGAATQTKAGGAKPGEGRRVGKRIDGQLVQGLLYGDSLSPVIELDGDGSTVKAQFVYAARAHVPDMMLKDGMSYRYVVDQVGSVRLVINTSDGSVAQRIDCDAFGVVLTDSNPGFQPFGFAGGLYDADTGLVRFGARDYDPSIGRWTAKDPILFNGGQANLYVYVGNDPVNFVDPEGLATHQVGVEFGLCVGVCISWNPNISTDGSNWGINSSLSLGFSSNIGVSAMGTSEWTTAASLDLVNGLEFYGGVGAGEGLGGALEGVAGVDFGKASPAYKGDQSAIGATVGLLPADVRGGLTFGWNLFSTQWWKEHWNGGGQECAD